MSDAENPPGAPPVPPPPPRNGWLTAFMVIVGIVLLCLCAIVFGVGNLGSSSPDPMITLLVFMGLAVGAGGILLIRSAIRGPRP
jgi:VIT1/CCC1 family predicted Fe2+/Mn2+ transporter